MSTLQIITARRNVSKAQVRGLLKFSGLILLFSPVITYNLVRRALAKVGGCKPVYNARTAVRKAYGKLSDWGHRVANDAEVQVAQAEQALRRAKEEHCTECRDALEYLQSPKHRQEVLKQASIDAHEQLDDEINQAKLRLRQALAL